MADAETAEIKAGDRVEVSSGWDGYLGKQVQPASSNPGQVHTATVFATVVEVGKTCVWLTGFSGACANTRSGQDPILRTRVLRVVEHTDKLDRLAETYAEGVRVFVRDPRGANVIAWQSVLTQAEEQACTSAMMAGDDDPYRAAKAKAARKAWWLGRKTAREALAAIDSL